jgi:hypothetical protein
MLGARMQFLCLVVNQLTIFSRSNKELTTVLHFSTRAEACYIISRRGGGKVHKTRRNNSFAIYVCPHKTTQEVMSVFFYYI